MSSRTIQIRLFAWNHKAAQRGVAKGCLTAARFLRLIARRFKGEHE